MQKITTSVLSLVLVLFVLTGLALPRDMTHIPDRDFNTLKAAGNTSPIGIWSDGTTMWVADASDRKMYAYNMRTRARDRGREFNLDAGNNPAGIWSDGTTMWVVNSRGVMPGGRIDAYNMRTKAPDPDRDFDINTLFIANNKDPRGIWSDGTTMWVTDRHTIYAYNMRTRARDRGRELSTSGIGNPGEIWSDGTTRWVVDRFDQSIKVYNSKSKSDDPERDLNKLLRDAGNRNPTGIWSDGTIMWVADNSDEKIYAYGGLGATDQGIVSEQAIQDFSMKISGSTGTLKVCVRDHECEDGDRIRVDIDGRSIFSGEIDNDWDCYTLDVWAGESYAVELTALNGTGYKGDCSYRDENTGEIRVTGENTETQVWRHRGGAGSKARIIVKRAW